MKILMAHNFYQITGGEDICFKDEAELLEKRRHIVVHYIRDNNEIKNYSLLQKIQLSMNTIWSRKTFRDFEAILQKERPDLVHFHNTFPLISLSALSACQKGNIPVVLTLHNYRMMCLNGLFLRDSQICEDCLNKKIAWPGVFHACYRDSFLQSGVVALMNAYHRMRRTWDECVDAYICLSEFSRMKFVKGGLPQEKIHIAPNFMEDPGKGDIQEDYAVFIGRLSTEKGIGVLLEALGRNLFVPLIIIGSGPMDEQVLSASQKLENVKSLGMLEHDEAIQKIRGAQFLICSSLLYETFGRVIMEAFVCGVPVIASRIGAIEELVQDGITGLLVKPGDPQDLSDKIGWLWNHPEEARRMGENARKYYLENLTPAVHYESLMQIYTSVLEGNK